MDSKSRPFQSHFRERGILRSPERAHGACGQSSWKCHSQCRGRNNLLWLTPSNSSLVHRYPRSHQPGFPCRHGILLLFAGFLLKVKLTQKLAAASATCPSENLRPLIYALVEGLLDKCPPEGRLYYILDTIEHCPFENLRAAAVGSLKKQIVNAKSVPYQCLRVVWHRERYSLRRYCSARSKDGCFDFRRMSLQIQM